MKVAYMLGSLNRGGTETLLLDVFKSADKAPYEFIGIHRKGGAYKDDFYQTKPRMLQCAPKRFGLLRYLHRLRKLLKQEGVTIVHAQQSVDGIYASLATIGTDIQVVETFHGYDIEASRADKLINSLSIRMADAVCFVSNAQKDHYIQQYNIQKCQNKLHVVYNGVDFTKLDCEYPIPEFLTETDSAKAEIHTDHAAQQSGIRLAMVGNFVSGRSQSVICRSIQLLREQGVTDFDFYFIGRRNEKEPWRYDDCLRFCQENQLNNVHFLGGRADVPAILQNIDGFVYSTDHDTFGIAVVEAMAAGVPVVVNDWVVMQEITQNGEWASLYESNNANDCARAIADFIEHREDRKQKAKLIAPVVRDEYSIERHISRLNEVYKMLK